MPKFIVQVQGKLVVTADTKEAAIERTNVFMANNQLPSFKGQAYQTEQIEEAQFIPAEV